MATVAQHAGVFRMDISASATTVTDISSGITAVRASGPTKNVGTHHTIGSAWQQTTEGGLLMSLQVTARVDTTATTAYGYLSDWLFNGSGSRTVNWFFPDATTGSIQISGEFTNAGADAIGTNTGGSGDAQTSTFTLQANGTITKAAAT